ncbi:MAG: phage terminase small subunit P27 family [Proteobacteria bacterium]|nr:phage terminase small subunit P27 family [Pseudomonadota bacterium]
MADRCLEYALDVIDGVIIAGPHVRDACWRHICDLETAEGRGLYYDYEEASESIAFFEEVLCLNGGQFEGKPFILLPWQAFIIGSIFGWKRYSDNYRRFRVAYIETGKGSGKSPLSAGVGIKGLVADNEPRAEIYAAATHRDQAKILFRDALAFFDQSPELSERLVASGNGDNRWNLAYPATSSFFRVISSENKGKSGPRPHICLLDEVHEHRSADIIEMLRAGFKFRKQPMSFMITNSGHDKTSVCWEYHEVGAKIAANQVQNDEFFAYICAMDEDDDPFENEECWIKANPSLEHGIPGLDYIRGQVTEARGMPSKESTVRRLNFCQWTDADNPWISSMVWMACADKDYDKGILAGRRCWGGLDLSSVNDLTAFSLVFEPSFEDQYWRLLVWFWVPGIGLTEKAKQDKVPYIAWRDAGYLNAIDRKTIEYEFVITDLVEICQEYDVHKIAFDRWNFANFQKDIDRLGAQLPEMEEFGQGFKSMSPAIKEFEKMLIGGKVRHNGNPVLTWCAANAVAVEDAAENKKLDKSRSNGRIDGIVAATMACGMIDPESGESVYDQRAREGKGMFSEV